MDQLTQTFQTLYLHEKGLAITALHRSPTNIQKCYIPKEYVKCYSVSLGDFSVVHLYGKKYVCKILPEFYTTTVRLDLSVEMVESDNYSGNCVKMNLSNNLLTFSSVTVNVVFKSYKNKYKWDSKNLVKLLKKYILNMYHFQNGCNIDLNNCDSAKKLNICSLTIIETEPSNLIASVSHKTTVFIKTLITKEELRDISHLHHIIGYNDIKKEVTQVINCNYNHFKSHPGCLFPPPKQILLSGPSGCGKSSLVKMIARDTKCSIVKLLSQSIINSEPGESEKALHNIFNHASKWAMSEGKCIIHLEEFNVLCPKNALKSTHSRRISSQLLKLLDDAFRVPGLVIIATTNSSENIDPSARRQGRLELEFNVGPPNEAERQEIIIHFVKLFKIVIDENIAKHACEKVASMTHGYAGVDLKYLCHEVATGHADFHKHWNDQVTVPAFLDFFKVALTKVMPSSLKSEATTLRFEENRCTDIGGLDNVKKQIDMLIWWPLIHKNAFVRMGINRPRGILLYGPPGCAKTSLVLNLAHSKQLTLLTVTPAQLYSPYVGEAEKILANLFSKARQNAPCIIFLDEIDSLVGGRNFGENQSMDVHSRVLATLLMEMDGVGNLKSNFSNDFNEEDDGVVVIAATNKPNNIDAALLRPGRFDKHIYVPLPSFASRVAILEMLTNNVTMAANVKISDIANMSEGFSGADIKNLYNEAVLGAMKMNGVDVKVLEKKHFDEALNVITPSRAS